LNKVQFDSIWFNGFSRAERNMWNGTGTFRAEFSRKIRNGPRFKMRWNLFRFVPFFELVWNVSAIPGGTERNWQPCLSPYLRGVHGSVRFGLDSKNQPNRIYVCVINSNRTGPETGSNRTGPVRLNPVFFGKNRET